MNFLTRFSAIKIYPMKTSREKHSRGYGNPEARRSRPQWRENEATGRDYMNDDLRDDRFSHGYQNPDYNRKNFWPDYSDREDHFEEDEPTGYFESHASGRRSLGGNRMAGYGDENSLSAREFERMRSGGYNNFSDQNLSTNRGYQRRQRNEPNPYYSDKYYYRPSDYDRQGFRKNSDSDNYNRYADEDEGYREPRYEEEDNYRFSGYQSYPAYRQGPEGYDEYRGRHVNEHYDSDRREYPLRKRPGIRDKRY
jgi:hypothetical protein